MCPTAWQKWHLIGETEGITLACELPEVLPGVNPNGDALPLGDSFPLDLPFPFPLLLLFPWDVKENFAFPLLLPLPRPLPLPFPL
jgi:hypothetical protein